MSIESFIARDMKCLKTHGWYAHCVPSNDGTPFGFNYHTHGMERSYGHRNIQCVMPMDFKVIHMIVSDIIEEIKKGKKFEPNVDYPDLVGGGYMVRFIEAKECGRKVLRLVVPDKNGKYEGKFAKQFELLDNHAGVPIAEQNIQVD